MKFFKFIFVLILLMSGMRINFSVNKIISNNMRINGMFIRKNKKWIKLIYRYFIIEFMW